MTDTIASIPEDVERAITKTARQIARNFPPVELDDCLQELRMHYLVTPSTQKITTAGVLDARLYSIAKEWALRERAAWHGTSIHYHYKPDDVRAVARTLFAYPRDAWSHTPVPEDARSVKRWSDNLEVMADFKAALEHVSAEHIAIMEYVNGPGRKENLTATEKKRHQRAIHKTTEQMNTLAMHREADPEGHPGKRRVISNATARAISEDLEG